MANAYKQIVIEDCQKGSIVGAGSLIIEKKFIRNTGDCGHIEDIVVDKTYRGKNLGLRIIQLLIELTKVNGCYKVILDCGDHNQKFYERCGFHRKGVQMALYMDESQSTKDPN